MQNNYKLATFPQLTHYQVSHVSEKEFLEAINKQLENSPSDDYCVHLKALFEHHGH